MATNKETRRAPTPAPTPTLSLSEAAAAVELDAYRREYEDERTWETLQEDEAGRLLPLDVAAAQRTARAAAAARSATATARVRRGVIRALVTCVDLSGAAAAPDMRPTRAAAAAGALTALARAFFDANQLSQLAVTVTRHGAAERVSDLGGAPDAHAAALAATLECGGAASLQNVLDLALSIVKPVPPYALREVLIFFCGLTTADPGDIGATIAACKAARVRVSVIGLAAEVYVCKRLAEETGGSCAVALDAGHLRALALAHAAAPPLRAQDAAPSLVRMGFPRAVASGPAGAAFIGPGAALGSGGFACPRCAARVAELPAACHVCGLALVSSPHLARSYHHLFPVAPYDEVGGEVEEEAGGGGASLKKPAAARAAALAAAASAPRPTPAAAGLAGARCTGCLAPFDDASGVVLECRGCGHLFCFDCDALVHAVLHVCPGCEARGGGGARQAAAPWVKEDG